MAQLGVNGVKVEEVMCMDEGMIQNKLLTEHLCTA
jgi:hypothetical protein